MDQTITEKLAQAEKNYPVGKQCTTPMGTPFTTVGPYHHDSQGNIFTSDWQFLYCKVYDEWATINVDQS
jgi:hypothetical protein